MADTLTDYSEKYLAQYAACGFETVLVAVRRGVVLQFLATHHPRRILEVGCGLEPLFLHCSDFESMTVVEPSAEFVEEARKRAASDARVQVLKGYMEELTPELRSLQPDAIVVSSLLHEVPDPARLLETIHDVSTPQTLVHFNVPNVRSFHRLLALEMGVISDLFEPSETEKRFHRHSRFDRASFERALNEGGFEVLEFGTYFVKPFTHAQMEALLSSGSIDRKVIDGLAGMAKYMPDLGCEMFANVRAVKR